MVPCSNGKIKSRMITIIGLDKLSPNRFRRFPKWAIPGVLALALGLMICVGQISKGGAEEAGEAFLALLFTAAPQEQADPQRFSPAYLEEVYRPLVTDDLWEAGLANRDFALLVGQAAREDCSFRPVEIQLERREGAEGNRATYLYTLTLEAVPQGEGESASTRETGVLVMEKGDGKWLAAYFRWNRQSRNSPLGAS